MSMEQWWNDIEMRNVFSATLSTRMWDTFSQQNRIKWVISFTINMWSYCISHRCCMHFAIQGLSYVIKWKEGRKEDILLNREAVDGQTVKSGARGVLWQHAISWVDTSLSEQLAASIRGAEVQLEPADLFETSVTSSDYKESHPTIHGRDLKLTFDAFYLLSHLSAVSFVYFIFLDSLFLSNRCWCRGLLLHLIARAHTHTHTHIHTR
jgi:hypothetical protein